MCCCMAARIWVGSDLSSIGRSLQAIDAKKDKKDKPQDQAE